MADAKSLHTSISRDLLPTSLMIHKEVSVFLEQQLKDLQRIRAGNDKVLDQLKAKWEEYDQCVSEIKTRKKKDINFMEKGQTFLESKGKEIAAKNKAIQSVNAGMKESITKIKTVKLAELPVEKEKTLHQMFSVVYEVLYGESRKNFVWEPFREKALKHEDGEDFIFRLVNVNFKDMKEEHYNDLLKIKNDPKFDDLSVNSPYAPDLINLTEWIDFVCFGKQFSDQKKISDHEYEKIRIDIAHRSDGALLMSQQFWTQALEQLDTYQGNLINYQSELKTLILGMSQTSTVVSEAQGKIAAKIQQVNQL